MAIGSPPTASPMVNGSALSLCASEPANSAKPAAIISVPVHGTGRARHAASPLPTNDSAETRETAASAVVCSRAAPPASATVPAAAAASAAAATATLSVQVR